ncbi:DEAD/DEAH box helicase [Acetatifactor muris]|uniref:RNA helicase n=1 Tax=Acetatifactor muris TaxID=879566 RepID=A0A2K4ZDE8_9FIRM|nr:DEAD/DEAH box helicase [Acetatifactor muris]MCR2046929.1 DEAD/DEAH box helicase [Acetatifactor muris]SOY28482.1 DEAD-box ATP-dependent RNA helicase CshA [Acetatifactor muris]
MSDLEALMGLDNVIGQAGMGTPLTDENQADRKGLEIEGPEPDSLATIEPLLDERIVHAVREMGFEKLTPIQVQAIPYLLQGEDIIGQAQTGTGKTAAFAIPALQKIDPDLKKLQTIILCPTRELAMQASEEIRNIAKYMKGIKVLPVYGGQEIGRQISGLRGVQIVVGTPGRVMDHMRRHTIKLEHVNMVVLDEADEMLDMGFREDMELILGEIPNAHQTALFSATMPQPILEIANRFQKDARLVKVATKELTIPLVSQRYYKVKSQDKDAACIRLLEYYQPKLCLIFCNTKVKVDQLAEVLKRAGFQAEGLHGDMSQHQRDVAMSRFRNGSTNMLIATDVAARGIDVDNVEAVINYDLPQDNEYYVHRIGRTGRAGRTGKSFTFVSGREIYRVRQLEHFCHTTIEEKKLPGASKVLKAKADKYLNRAWELREHEDIELMKHYLQRKMEAEACDALDLAAVMLKYQIGDKGPEIEADDYESRRGERDRFGRRRRGRTDDRDSRRGRGSEEDRRRYGRTDDRDSRRRRGGEEDGRRRGYEDERDSRRRRGHEGEREESRRRGFEQERDSRRNRNGEEDRDSRRRRERDGSRVARAKDVRMDGSEKGLTFPFSKKKKRDRKN